MNGAGRRGAEGRLCRALRGGCELAVEALLQRGADPNVLLPGGFAPIHLAAAGGQEGSVRCLRLLLHHGGDPNARSAEGLTPLHVAASLGCYGCLELLLQEGGDAELRDQDGKRAMELALEQGHGLCVQLLQDWARTEALRGARRSLSFLTEDCSDVGPLSSTRLSQLEEPGLRSSCGSGEPPAWLGCAPARSIPSLALWPPRGSALPPQPLASSTLLWAAGDPGEGPLRGTGMCSPPKHSTGARSPPQPLRCSGDQGVLQAGAGGGDHLGDSSGDSECFVSAVETLEPSRAGGCPGEAPSPAEPLELPPCSPLAAEELPALLQGCTLGCSPPCTLAGSAAGGVTSQGLQPPQFCHVTPRTKSRLQASAARLSASSSSSLFDDTLEMPRRPPRVRAPRGVPRDPVTTSGRHITPRGEDMSSRDTESTGSSDDTQILPRTPDQAGSPVGTSSSSPTVLLGPGDRGVLQDSPSDAQGSPRSTDLRVLEQGNPPVPRSPTARSPHRPVEPNGEVPSGWHSPGTEATSACDTAVPKERARSPRVLSDDALIRRLRALGYDPGPITELTRRVYLRRLEELSCSPTGHSPELVAALRTGHIPDCTEDEVALARQFDRPDRSRHWREGLLKASFNYLLLDPRTTQDLPQRCHRLSPTECFRTFIDAIFYVGKGTRARPCCHLAEALTQYHLGTKKGCPKVRRILEIWASGMGVISLQCFQGRIPAEAYTRESCLVEALGLRAITNQRKGNCYGVAASWPPARRRRLGVHMLHRALHIFLAEGEQQLRPDDISTGR